MSEIASPFLYEMVPASKLAEGDVIYLNDDQLRIISISEPQAFLRLAHIVRVMRLANPPSRVSFVLSAEKIVPVLRQFTADPVLVELLAPVVAEYEAHGIHAPSRLLAVADYMIIAASCGLSGALAELLSDPDEERSATPLSSLIWSVFVTEIQDRHKRSRSGFRADRRIRQMREEADDTESRG